MLYQIQTLIPPGSMLFSFHLKERYKPLHAELIIQLTEKSWFGLKKLILKILETLKPKSQIIGDRTNLVKN